MEIEDFTGTYQVNTDTGIESLLARRSDDGLNHFWLTEGPAPYPALAIFANRELACILTTRASWTRDSGRSGLHPV